MELFGGNVEPLAAVGVNRSGQAVVGTVCNVKCVRKAAGPDHREHGTEDLFLCDAGSGCHVRDDGGLNVPAVGFTLRGYSAGQHTTFSSADRDVVEHALVSGFADDRAHRKVVGRVTLLDLRDEIAQLVQENVVDVDVDDGTGAGGTLLPVEAECGSDHTLDRGVDIAIAVDNDRVLAAEFQHRTLQEALARLLLCSALMHVQADLLGAGKADEAHLRMLDERASGQVAASLQQVHHALGHTRFFEKHQQAHRDGRRVDTRLHDYGVAGDHRGCGHAAQDRERKIPWRDDGTHAQRQIP